MSEVPKSPTAPNSKEGFPDKYYTGYVPGLNPIPHEPTATLACCLLRKTPYWADSTTVAKTPVQLPAAAPEIMGMTDVPTLVTVVTAVTIPPATIEHHRIPAAMNLQ